MWFKGVLTVPDNDETPGVGILSLTPTFVTGIRQKDVGELGGLQNRFLLPPNFDELERRSDAVTMRIYAHTFPYTRAKTPAVSSCSSVQRLHLPVTVSDQTLNDFRGSNAAVDPASPLNGLPAQRTFFC